MLDEATKEILRSSEKPAGLPIERSVAQCVENLRVQLMDLSNQLFYLNWKRMVAKRQQIRDRMVSRFPVCHGVILSRQTGAGLC